MLKWRTCAVILTVTACCVTTTMSSAYFPSIKAEVHTQAENAVTPSPSPSATPAPANAPAATTAPIVIVPPVPAFLKEIGISEAWALLDTDVTATIAIIDTGVDFNHPELKPYLLAGKNIVNERKTAQDDNGHGTAVAGIIVSAAKQGAQSTGAGRWKGQLLPIKALDEFGEGSEDKLTKSIRYAVDHGANIIVLSLGLRRDAKGLREAVAYAESKGVLLIAASGNDAAVFGKRAAVQYPAAYPTVLSVAGSNGTKSINQSTAGPENDVSASWVVQTLALGGGMTEMEGTSMGAPQVAAAAAMLMAAHPDWKPVRIRETLRRSAHTNGSSQWNPDIGYGLVSAIRALQADSMVDWREPNNSQSTAKEFPLGKEVLASWDTSSDIDWYTIDIPYDGYFSLSGNAAELSLYAVNTLIKPASTSRANASASALMQWPVTKGRYLLKASRPEGKARVGESYRLVSGFTMHADANEPNDQAISAVTLPARNQSWTGTFHQQGDEDWFVVTLPKPGMLKIKLSTDTTRIDPKLWIQRAGSNAAITVDERGDGGTEQWAANNTQAGKYYIRISNAVSSNPEAVIGTYNASLEYITEKEDSYEPNELPLTSTPLTPDKVYNALIQSKDDQDWYRFTISKKQTITLTISHIPENMGMEVELQDKKLKLLDKWNHAVSQKTLVEEKQLLPGTYYLKVTADRANRNQYYGLKLNYVKD